MAEDTLFYKTLDTGSNWATSLGSGTNSPLPGGRNGFVNLPKDFAALNRKNMRHTDNKGYPLTYLVEVELLGSSSAAQEAICFTAPETWVLKNAVRKWHIARNQMLARAGLLETVGEYTRTIRPYLTAGHKAYQGDAVPDMFAANSETTWSSGNEATSPAIQSAQLKHGEWSYTEIAATADIDENGGEQRVDRYHLTLTGDHNPNSGTEYFANRVYLSVSMMRAYLESRRNVSRAPDGTDEMGQINAEPNPLLNLISDSTSIGEVKEIAQSLHQERSPYQAFQAGDTSALNTNSALDLVSKCHLSTTTTYLKDKEVIRVPMGLMHVRTTANNSETPQLRIRLLGIDKAQG